MLPRIQALKPDVLCVCNFGRDMQISLKQATDFGVKKNHAGDRTGDSLFSSRVAGGAQAFEGVIGGTSYYWGLRTIAIRQGVQ